MWWLLITSVQCIFGRMYTVDRQINQYIIVVPLFGAAYAAPIIDTTVLY